jgi:hypothetical protein
MQWDVGSWVWFAGVGAGTVVLGLVLAYGSGMWRRAQHDRPGDKERDAATREVYRQEERRNRTS